MSTFAQQTQFLGKWPLQVGESTGCLGPLQGTARSQPCPWTSSILLMSTQLLWALLPVGPGVSPSPTVSASCHRRVSGMLRPRFASHRSSWELGGGRAGGALSLEAIWEVLG